MTSRRLKPATLLAHGGQYLDPVTGGVVPPIQPSTTFARRPDYRLVDESHTYGRDDASNVRHVEALLRDLEGGAAALAFPSGMAAIAALFRTFTRGDAVAVQKSLYYGADVWVSAFCARAGVALHRFEGARPGTLEAVVRRHRPKLVWAETPSNPLLDVVDLREAARIARTVGALLAVDSTAAGPVLTRPLEHGADLVMHAATKSLNGHSDVLAGILVTARDDQRWAQIRADRHDAGALLGPFEAWLLLRGLRTLALRVRAMSEGALQIARFLEQHPKVERVRYPGLEGHPGHELALRQMTGGFGGLLSFEVEGGAEAALRIAGRLELIVRATSLGGVESLIEHRASIEPPSTGIPPGLLRLSVGIEDPDDLIADLDQALNDR
ncbi:MAG: PLP-dependent aspartate aminotransferase family protein [Geminicoccaceae bacterium]|nr:PLP-dependent aspartate aminotransferase family protein [Geminicoccaceae bacterium]